MKLFERLERMHEENDKDDNHYHEYHPRPSFDVASPADTFHVELTFDHPYWDNIKWDWTGVSLLDSDSPSVEAFFRAAMRIKSRESAHAGAQFWHT